MPRNLTTQIKSALAADTVKPVYLAKFDFDVSEAENLRNAPCLSFDGFDDHVIVPDNTALDISLNLTVSIWAKNTNALLEAPEALMSKYEFFVSDLTEWTFYIDQDEKINVVLSDDGVSSNFWTSTNPIANLDNWNHFAFVFDGGTSLTVYINGSSVPGSFVGFGALPASLYNGTAKLRIGASGFSATIEEYNWRGQLFDARIYGSSLAASDIKNIYAGKNVGLPSAWYKLNEGSGSVANDWSGNGNNGTLTNFDLLAAWANVHNAYQIVNNCVWTGQGELNFDSLTWSDELVVTQWPTIKESVNLTAENITLTLNGNANYGVDLTDVNIYRGRPCEIYIGFLDSSGNLPSTNVYKVFSGRMAVIDYNQSGQEDTYKLTVESRLVDLTKSKEVRYTHQSQLQRYPGGVVLTSGDLVVGELYEVTNAGTGANFSAAGGPASPALGNRFIATATTATWGSPAAELTSLPDMGLEYAGAAQDALFLSRGETPDKPFSRKVIYGTTVTAGDVVFVATSGAGSRYLNLVVAFADHECDAIEQLYLDDRGILSGGVVSGEFFNVVDYYPRLGTTNQAYISELETELTSTFWDDRYRLRGITYVYLRILYSEELFGTDAPAVSALIRGKKIYDPRSATTAFSDNSALVIRDYLLSQDYGFSSGSADVEDTLLSVAANDCDLLVDRADATTEKRYTTNGVVDTAQITGENLKNLLNAFAGKISYTAGVFAVYSGNYALTAQAIGDADFISDIQFSNRNLREAFNGVRGLYRTPDLDWQQEDYPAYQDASAVAADGEERWLDIPLPFTTSPARCQRIGKIAVKRSRAAKMISVATALKCLDIRTGDVIALTTDKTALGSVVYEVKGMAINLSPLPTIQFTFLEVAASDYSWDETTEEKQLTVPEEPADSILAWTLARLNAPSATPGSKTFNATFNVTVSHNETGVTVRYTLDGTEPNETDSSVANGGTIAIPAATTTLKLKSFQNVGSLTSDVVTYEYTYTPPTTLVPTPTHRWSWDVDALTAADNYPILSYAITGLAGCNLYNSENGGSTWPLLKSNTADGTYYVDPTEIPSSWTPSNYRAYGTKSGYINSNQLIVPNQLIPPLLWKELAGGSTYYVGCQVWAANCSIWRRFATRSKVSGGWSSWSSWTNQDSSSKGWGDYIGTAFPFLQIESSNSWWKWEFYISQSGWTDSVVMFVDPQANDWKYGGESGVDLGSIISKGSSYS